MRNTGYYADAGIAPARSAQPLLQLNNYLFKQWTERHGILDYLYLLRFRGAMRMGARPAVFREQTLDAALP